MKARISEIFESIQGEGIYQGIRQVFVRFSGCNLNCKFCDTKLSSYEELSLDELLDKLGFLSKDFHSLSLTGGEPLLQINFLKVLLKELNKKNITTYLETNGTLFKEIEEIVDYVDIVAMDFKLPSSTGLNSFFKEHQEFLKICLDRDVFVKTVICKSTNFFDLKRAIDILTGFKKDVPFVLQPNYFELDDELMEKLFKFKEFSLKFLRDVRIIPQLHKFIGVK
ncbi:MAG: 7-carboxy-7-deazaguanine synthase QueE [Candidatus Omnitrophica bacterium]|nr:7-carboxy-7-deazaguanine synthase QueE [Candidatus Omnitrophota bacterium]